MVSPLENLTEEEKAEAGATQAKMVGAQPEDAEDAEG